MWTRLRTVETDGARQLLKGVVSRMAKPSMPKRAGVGGQKCRCRWWRGDWSLSKRIELSRGITSEQCHPGAKILDGETPGIKFNRHVIITS
jgi:hypothetical protein